MAVLFTVNVVVGLIWLVPTAPLAFLTVALAGMTPPSTLMSELFFLISLPFIFLAAALTAAPIIPGSKVMRLLASATLMAGNITYLAFCAFALMPLVIVLKLVANLAGRH